MLLGRVIGTVVTCAVYDGLQGVPMLVVQPLDKHQQNAGSPIVCCDATRMAGPDELVYYEGGREAAMVLEPSFVPVDHSIIGIVDGLSLSGADRSPATIRGSEPGSVNPVPNASEIRSAE